MLATALLALTLGCAHHPPHGLVLEPLVFTGRADLADISGLTNAEILDAAVERLLRGDDEGALARIEVVLAQKPAPPETPAALYQEGLCLEHLERPAEALAVYDTLVREYPDAPEVQSGWFRRALCLEDLGRHGAARRSLAHVSTAAGLDLHDRLTLDLQRGISLVRSGRERAGLRLLTVALAAAEGSDQVTWLRAKAHVTEARLWLAAAARQDLQGREKAVVAELEERARCLAAAEKEVAAAARLGEPEWILEGLLLLGAAYQDLHDALLASSRPAGLTPEQLALYDDALWERGTTLLVKAWNHYDTGIAKAGEWRWDGPVVARLHAAREAIDLAGLPAVPPPAPAPPPETPGGAEPAPDASSTPPGGGP
jgi:tetratricopeptide (TPR) repeat protein